MTPESDPPRQPVEPAAPADEPGFVGGGNPGYLGAERAEAPGDSSQGSASPLAGGARAERTPNMLPGRDRRRFGLERVLVRLVATCGVVGIGVALGAILASSKVQGWITGLVVALVSVILSAILWSSRQL